MTIFFVRDKYGAKEPLCLERHIHDFTSASPPVSAQIDDLLSSTLQHTHYYTDGTRIEDKEHIAVFYATINPRNTRQAAIKTILEEQRHLYSTTTEDNARTYRPDRTFKNNLQNCPLDRRYFTIDVDVKVRTTQVLEMVASEHIPIYCMIETRGGYHIIIETDQLRKTKTLVPKLGKLTFEGKTRDGKTIQKQVAECSGDMLCPIPGTLQGGFLVRLVPLIPPIIYNVFKALGDDTLPVQFLPTGETGTNGETGTSTAGTPDGGGEGVEQGKGSRSCESNQ